MSKLEKDTIVREFDVTKTEKVNVVLNPFYDGNEHKYKRTKRIYKKVDRVWKLAREETSILSFEQVHPDLKSEITIQIIVKRSNIDHQTLKNIYALFLTSSKITANSPKFKLSIVDGMPFLHSFDGASIGCQYLSPVLPSEFCQVKVDENYKRISIGEAQKLLRKGIKIFEEDVSARPENRFRVFTVSTGRKY